MRRVQTTSSASWSCREMKTHSPSRPSLGGSLHLHQTKESQLVCEQSALNTPVAIICATLGGTGLPSSVITQRRIVTIYAIQNALARQLLRERPQQVELLWGRATQDHISRKSEWKETKLSLTSFRRLSLVLFLSLVKAFPTKGLSQGARSAAFWTRRPHSCSHFQESRLFRIMVGDLRKSPFPTGPVDHVGRLNLEPACVSACIYIFSVTMYVQGDWHERFGQLGLCKDVF